MVANSSMKALLVLGIVVVAIAAAIYLAWIATHGASKATSTTTTQGAGTAPTNVSQSTAGQGVNVTKALNNSGSSAPPPAHP